MISGNIIKCSKQDKNITDAKIMKDNKRILKLIKANKKSKKTKKNESRKKRKTKTNKRRKGKGKEKEKQDRKKKKSKQKKNKWNKGMQNDIKEMQKFFSVKRFARKQ